jgi:dihydrofolate reductase
MLAKPKIAERKLIVFNMLSMDGFFEGPSSDISWHKVDKEVNTFIIEQLKTTDTLLFGRKTFETMESFWASKEAFEQDPETAKLMGEHSKLVFSKTRNKSNWKNTGFVHDEAEEIIEKLKAVPGKDLFVFGSADLSQTLMENKLVDEFRIMLNPVVLGKGRKYFSEEMELVLSKVKVFGNGNLLLVYHPK